MKWSIDNKNLIEKILYKIDSIYLKDITNRDFVYKQYQYRELFYSHFTIFNYKNYFEFCASDGNGYWGSDFGDNNSFCLGIYVKSNDPEPNIYPYEVLPSLVYFETE